MTNVKAEEKFITVNNLRLRYLDWGGEGKPPLVCLHGHTGQAHIWDEFAVAMSSHYHVYALDQRGHGGSQWAADGYERDRFVEDLACFVDALALPRFALAGLSMGGWNCHLYASSHPDRVDRVIIVDIAPEFSEASRQLQLTRPPVPMEFDSFADVVAWARAGNPWVGDERLNQDIADRTRQRDDGKWVWKADPALFSTPAREIWDTELNARYWRSLAAVNCPLLVVRGKGSVIISDEILERMRQANPRISIVDVEQAGHVVPVDKPQEFIAVTGAFMGVPDSAQ